MILNASKEGRYIIVSDIPLEYHELLSLHVKRCISDFVDEMKAQNEAVEQFNKDVKPNGQT
jgi:hypothetical protein